jgi:hypothetical protein
MTTPTSTRERRDWTLLIFIIPIGIILMLIAGQVAIRLVPAWSINAGMQSKLDPNNLPQQQNGLVQPVLPAILTPLGWLDTFLTPGADSGNQDIVFPPFVIFEPSATPAVTLPPPTAATTQPSPTIPVTASPTVVVTSTSPPPVTGTSKPPVDPPTSTPPTPTPPTSIPTTSIPPTLPPVTSTSTGVQVPTTPTPAGLNIGAPDNSIFNLSDGFFYVLDLGSNQIKVNGPSDTGYDMVYYEWQNPVGYISLDQVILGISTFADGHEFYTVFNWFNGTPDLNSNVVSTGTENDNQQIPMSGLYGAPLQTGVAIDVDNAPSAPPIGLYQYVVIQAPTGVSSDGLDVDSIGVIPDPPLPAPKTLILPAEGVPIQPTTEAPTQSATEAPVQSATEAPVQSATEAPVQSATEAPVQSATEAPVQSATEAPVQPAAEVPAQPAAEVPAQPATEVPAQPATEAPAQPATEAPTTAP